MPAIPAASRSPPPGAAAAAARLRPQANRRSTSSISRARPMAISALQQELLALFDKQSASLLALSSDRSAERRRRADAAHQLKGSALALGAGAVARAAAAVEAALAGARPAPRRSKARSPRWRWRSRRRAPPRRAARLAFPASLWRA